MYCAHCGVELMKSTDRCPLCETPVHPMPAPETSAPCRGRLRRKTRLNLLFLALCLHVIAVVLATDLALNNGLSWSVYVMGAVVLVYFWVIFPLLVSKARECLSGALNFGLLAVYLWAIEQIAGGRWFLTLALPIVLTLYLFSQALTFLVKRYPRHALAISGGSWMMVGVFLLLLEAILHFTFGGEGLQWSPYVMVCFLTVGTFLLTLAFSPTLREKLEKRLFI